MILLALFCVPLIAMCNIIITPRNNYLRLNKIALFWSLLELVLFIVFLLLFSKIDNFQFSYSIDWLNILFTTLGWGSLIINYDGISIFFLGLSIILIPISLLISWVSIKNLKKEFILFLFLILSLLIAVFSIMDILVFYILFEAILIPMFLIIGIWGSREEKIKASFYFFFYTLIGSLLMLLSIFKLYSITGSTNYFTLIAIDIPHITQFWLFLGFFASFSVKIPMIPFHIWLPQAHVEAPVAGSVLLAGILLKLGGYGFIRFSYPLFPIASEYFSPFIVFLSLLAIIYASFTTCRQTDIKRLIAYSSVSHMGLVTLALFTHSSEGLIASIIMMLAHGLVSSGMFMTSAILYVRHHSRIIKYFRGVVIMMPIFSIISLVLILANMSFPLTLNFIAEFLSITAAFSYSHVVGLLSCTGILLGTVYSLYFYNRIYFGNVSSYIIKPRELLRYEFNSFVPLLILTILLGFFPNLIIKVMNYSNFINISL
uniref:NADH-ubiquinone oxidoreductase chain 4 n=1 Tax=Spirocodon saltatrix TaxID=6093 RepID=A0A7D5SNL4_9CNID|nr:NADH dehydrogenase subunit 4 [Spirocodon saltatrix]QLH56863.1 NADH dehydrogenase subunit 4 [Spirocodon saltatrix]